MDKIICIKTIYSNYVINNVEHIIHTFNVGEIFYINESGVYSLNNTKNSLIEGLEDIFDEIFEDYFMLLEEYRELQLN